MWDLRRALGSAGLHARSARGGACRGGAVGQSTCAGASGRARLGLDPGVAFGARACPRSAVRLLHVDLRARSRSCRALDAVEPPTGADRRATAADAAFLVHRVLPTACSARAWHAVSAVAAPSAC